MYMHQDDMDNVTGTTMDVTYLRSFQIRKGQENTFSAQYLSNGLVCLINL